MERRGIAWVLAGAFALSAVLGVACQDDRHGALMIQNEDCVTCHLADYQQTSMPPHDGLFPQTCGMCHSEDAWVPAVAIDHSWFVLQNRHAEIACTDCHTAGFRPGDTPNTCVGCHQADYDMATMPPHAGYPTECAQCHDDAGWSPSIFVHSFPLDGAHAVTPCNSCHTGTPPVYEGTPNTCVGCHQADYDRSPFPGHDAFPTDCVQCHTTTAWVPALNGAHPNDRFDISRGPHDYACLDCHNPDLGASTAGMNADCVGCHEGEHTRAEMDGKHREVGGYPTGAAPPNFCLECHADGTN